MNSTPKVFLVDDEPGLLKALTRLLRAEGFSVTAFSNAEDFLANWEPSDGGCLVLDVAMPGIDGLDLQRRLREAEAVLPIVFLSGNGDIPMSVRAIKAGAIDFLTKPVNDAQLLAAVRAALAKGDAERTVAAELTQLRERFGQLTPRERDVLKHVVAGRLNKQIAAVLGTGEQNVKIHRGRVMEKMCAPSLADLVRMAARLGLHCD